MFFTMMAPARLGDLKNKVVPVSGDELAVTIDADAMNVVLYDFVSSRFPDIDSYGYVTVTINSGITIGASSTSLSGLNTGSSWNPGTVLEILNYGSVYGAGGAGGDWDADTPGDGGDGGDAITCAFDCIIRNFGLIAGGGGGGGGGDQNESRRTANGANKNFYAEGGGGAGYTPGIRGTGKVTINAGQLALSQTASTSGTKSSGGVGDLNAGNGGNLGTNGDNGIGNGGTAGKAIEFGGNTVTYVDAGTTRGATS